MIEHFNDFLLPEPLLRGIEKAGWQRPMPVQAQVIPLAMEGHDLLVSAATGSGKTGAFLLPMMQRFADQPAPRAATRGLVLVPTRELARQVRAHFLALGGHTRLTAAVITGGENRGHQVADLRKNPDIIVATPGRLVEHLENGEIDLDDLEVLVLDEADRMLDLGFLDDVLSIIGATSARRQSLLFSATLHHRRLGAITDRLLREPRVIVVDAVRTEHPDISHQVLLSDDMEHKQHQLLWLLRHEDYAKALVFTNTRERAVQIGGVLQGEQVRAGILHGELDQRERKRVMGLLQRGEISVLVATDVAARGLDLPGMQRVINLDIPRSGDEYLHRTGRTGRAGEPGTAISLVAGPEWNRMESIQRYLGLSIETRSIDGLEARFRGPVKTKKPRAKPSGAKAPATKRGAGRAQTPADGAPKPKNRLRDRKNIGKRRKPSADTSGSPAKETGFAPPKRRDTDR
jgi:superfamily II DNA/RNA helicase